MSRPEVDGLNTGYAALLLEQYLDNPSAVPSEWRALFESAPEELLATQPGLATGGGRASTEVGGANADDGGGGGSSATAGGPGVAGGRTGAAGVGDARQTPGVGGVGGDYGGPGWTCPTGVESSLIRPTRRRVPALPTSTSSSNSRRKAIS